MKAQRTYSLALLAATIVSVPVPAQVAVTPVRRAATADSTGTPKLGDTVTVAGRVSLGTGVLDTGRTVFYLEGFGGGLHVYGNRLLGRRHTSVGDSLVVTGALARYHGVNYLDASRISAIPGIARAPEPIRVATLVPSVLAAHVSRLVSVSGVVVASSIGRGDHVLRIATDTGTAGIGVVNVTESDAGTLDLDFTRFEHGDRLTAVGVLVPKLSLDGPPAYLLYPRSAADVRPLQWTIRSRRRSAYSAMGGVMLAILMTIALRLRRSFREERARTRHASMESATRYRRLVEEAPMGMLVYHAGRILFANAAFAEIVGVKDVRTLFGTRLLHLVRESERAATRERFGAETAGDSALFKFKHRFRRFDGKTIELSFVCAPTAFEGLPAMQAIVYDVTAQAALEAQLLQAQKMEAIGQLAAGVAHDFNNMLTVILSCSDMALLTLPKSTNAISDVEAIKDAAERAAGLTRQLLAFSRRQTLQPQPVDLACTIQNVAPMLQRMIGEDIVLGLDLMPDVWRVSADLGQLEQVLMNLAVNARDAMPHGGTLTLGIANAEIDAVAAAEHPDLAPGSYASITIVDSGTGIAPDILPRLFEPFFTTKEAGKGTGLGLATVYGIVKQSGGHISVNSTIGHGTQFTILLPRNRGSDQEVPLTVAPVVKTPSVGTILLVEDDESVRTVAQRILAQRGYDVISAINGAEGLRALSDASERGVQVDLVVSDVRMPEVGGRALGAYLDLLWPALPILYMSGYADDATQPFGPMSAVAHFLEKPFTPESLMVAVQRALDPQTVASVD